MDRRSVLLGLGGVLALSACGGPADPAVPGLSPTPAPSPTPTPTPTLSGAPSVAALEKASGARIGVFAQRIGGAAVGHRGDERFPMCSTFKVFAVAAALDLPSATVVRYRRADLLDHAPITRAHVATGMSIGDLCDAAIRYSDNTAANLLLRQVGGPGAVTRFLRALGDDVTRLDRSEPDVNTAIGDERDTTTPAASAADLRALLLGPGVPPGHRTRLADWMGRNTTGTGKIRAAVPRSWTVADKTGSGDHGTSNDVALLRPPSGAPIVLTVFTTGAPATPDPTLVARVARAALADLGRSRRASDTAG